VSSNDTTPGYLNGKLVAGTNITLTENNNGGDETLTISAAGGGGGLTGFTGSQNSTGVNITVNASQLLADATSANADIVLSPKGTGAILAQLPDGTSAGGNKRNSNAVDLQTARDGANEVASGAWSVVAGGRANKATGSYSVCVGGWSNSANQNYAFIGAGYANITNNIYAAVAGGYGNLASGQAAAIAGGQQNTSSGTHSFIGGGISNTSSGSYSTILGGQNNVAPGNSSVVGGGSANEANSLYTVVVGGQGNRTGTGISNYAVCVGGGNNTAGGTYSFVGGGSLNTCAGGSNNSAIAGGTSNTCEAAHTVICGGQSNQNRQAHGFVGGGSANNANGNHSVISGGNGNRTHAQYTAIIGGDNNETFGLNSSVLGGRVNVAIGDFSAVLGFHATSSNYGSVVHASGGFASVNGSCQTENYVQRTITTTNAQTELTQDGQAAGVNVAASMRIENDSTYAFDILLIARRADADNESAAWRFTGCIDNNAGTTAFVGTPTNSVLGDDSSGVWLANIVANNTNDRLALLVTGENGKTIRWAATIRMIKITG
jgi:hypothetical protein